MKTKPPKADDPSAAPPFRARRGKRKLSAAELKLWTAVTDGVAPLAPEVRAAAALPVPEPVDAPAAPPPPPKRRAQAAQSVAAPAVPPPAPAPHRPDKVELAHGATPGVDKRTAGRFKKGKMAVEGKLDLHGHFQHEAHVALKRFIAAAYAAEKRCVLVVTGKGKRGREREGAVGVLKESVPRWLNEPSLRAKVLSFSFAAPADGGEGALYVLLKRRRDAGA